MIQQQKAIWFPGHMSDASKRLPAILKKCDILLEVGDARAPVSSINNDFYDRQKKHWVLFNKKQAADNLVNLAWRSYFSNTGQQSFFCNFFDTKDIKEIFNSLIKMSKLKAKNKTSLKYTAMRPPFRVLVVGLPNTGKSTLINRLLQKKRVKIGATPGITRKLEWVKINYDLEILDSPGIILPKLDGTLNHAVMTLIYAQRDDSLNLDQAADFLLSILIKQPTFEFLSRYKLEDDLSFDKESLILLIAQKLNIKHKDEHTRLKIVKQKIVRDFRQFKLGKISLEKPDLA